MPILILIGGLIALVWGLLLFRFLHKSQVLADTNWFPILLALVVIVGSVFGRDFWAIDVGPIPVTLDRILLGGLVLGFVIMIFGGYLRWQVPTLADYSFLVLTLVLTCSTLAHDWGYLEKMPLSRLLFFNLLPFAVYVLARHCDLRQQELTWVLGLFAVFGLYLAFTGIAEWRTQYWAVYPKYILNPDFAEFLGRARGPFLNPVSNGLFIIVGLASIGMWFYRTSNPVHRALCLGLASILVIGVVSTLTRSVWLTCALALLMLGWIPASKYGRSAILIAAGIGVIGIVGFPKQAFNEFKRDKNVTVHEMKQSASLRPMFAVVAWRMFQDRPLLGCGFGQYAREKYPYLQDPTSQQPLQLTRSYMQHNIFLAYLTETGLVGLGVLLLMFSTFTWHSVKLYRDKRKLLIERQIGLLMGIILMGHVVNGMFHDVSIAPQLNLLVYFFAGLTLAVATKKVDLPAVLEYPQDEYVADTQSDAKAA